MAKKRRIFEPGHGRKLLAIVETSRPRWRALFYASVVSGPLAGAYFL